jgi:hypothetical protein
VFAVSATRFTVNQTWSEFAMKKPIQLLLGMGALALTACTTMPGQSVLPISAADDGLSSGTVVTLSQSLPVAPDTARAYFSANGRWADGLNCYVEVNTVQVAGDPVAMVEPGTFNVEWSRNSSAPIGALNRPTRWGFNENSPSFVEMVHTIRLSDDRGTDVRAIVCRETFTDPANARYPGASDLQTIAGEALSF